MACQRSEADAFSPEPRLSCWCPTDSSMGTFLTSQDADAIVNALEPQLCSLVASPASRRLRRSAAPGGLPFKERPPRCLRRNYPPRRALPFKELRHKVSPAAIKRRAERLPFKATSSTWRECASNRLFQPLAGKLCLESRSASVPGINDVALGEQAKIKSELPLDTVALAIDRGLGSVAGFSSLSALDRAGHLR